MKFKRLRLSGFKSFVEPIELYIEPGVTGIVGPNGCGKSNLVEALRWVMGENSPKSMRSSGMEDVIFSGTANRPERNFAEVTVLLDNSERKAPAQFNDDSELEVSRRIEREAGSAYRVNGREVRQRDVQLLFADAATGAHAPSMVSQGRVGALINAKPRERRAILEEAAGIMGLHSRRHEAELRLRAAETNLTRLDDVMGQLESQYKALKRQARQAARYRTLSARTRKSEATLLYLRWRAADRAVAEAHEALQEAERLVGERTKDEAGASAKLADITAGLPKARNEEAEAAAALHRLTVERDHLDAEEARARETSLRLKQRIEQINQDKSREDAMIADSRQMLTRLEQEEQALKKQAEQQAEAEKNARDGAEKAAQAAHSAEAALDELSREHAARVAKRNAVERDLDTTRRRIADIEAELSEMRSAIAALSADADEAPAPGDPEDIENLSAAVEKNRRAFDEAEAASRKARTHYETTIENLNDVEGRLTTVTAEANALSQIVTPAQDAAHPVLDEISVDDGYETALGVAIGDDLEASVDDNADIRWRILGPLSDAPSLPGGVVPLAKFVRAPQALARRLTQIGIVGDDEGEELSVQLKSGQRLVSRKGSLWRWDGYTMRAGARSAAAVRLHQRNRLKEVEEKIDDLTAHVTKARRARDEAQAALTQCLENEHAARQAWRDSQDDLDRARAARAEAAEKRANRQQRRAELEGASARLEQELETARANLEREQAEHENLPDPAALDAQIEEARNVVENKRSALAEARAAMENLTREADARERRLRAIEQERQSWQARLDNARSQADSLAAREKEAEAELSQLEDIPAQIQSRRNSLLDRLSKAEEKRRAAADSLAELENAARDAERETRKKQQALSEAREARVRQEAALEAAGERREAVVGRMAEAFDGGPEEAVGYAEIELPEDGSEPDLPPVEKVEAQLERLRRERDTMGPVNLRAEEEAQELNEQIEAMRSERQDLDSAIARLRGAIGSLNREGRQRLLKAFEEVNSHFAELFTELFGGGRAYLTLTESDDPLEAGLEIMAQPPGKKLQVMSLLSGGEQALTALSLIFAVFLTNPAPICVLDEVDAPLDDANVERMCRLIDAITEKTETRFIIVTHNPITMANVDRLFGVTMAERGVSQLVSVDLDRAERLRAVG